MLKNSLIFVSIAFLAGFTALATEEIHIGALIPEKGVLEKEGKLVRIALERAKENINERFQQRDEYKVYLSCEGTDPDTPASALEKLKALKSKGVNVVVGPATDAELAAVKDFADKEKIILISYGCTSMAYAVADDNIFRVLPDDCSPSAGLSKQISTDKVAAVIILEKGDAFGKALGGVLKESLGKSKCKVIEEIQYSPDLKDISTVLAELEKKVAEVSKKYGEGKLAVVVAAASGILCQGASCSVSCDINTVKCENLSILKEAAKFPVFSKVRWYLASSPDEKCVNMVNEDKALADFLVRSRLLYPEIIFNETDEFLELRTELKKFVSLIEYSAYPFAAYDALGLAVDVTKNCIASGRTEFRCLKEDLGSRARFSHGITGFAELNEKGDRVAGDVDFMQLMATGSSFEWVPVSRYFASGDTCFSLEKTPDERPKATPLKDNKMFPVK